MWSTFWRLTWEILPASTLEAYRWLFEEKKYLLRVKWKAYWLLEAFAYCWLTEIEFVPSECQLQAYWLCQVCENTAGFLSKRMYLLRVMSKAYWLHEIESVLLADWVVSGTFWPLAQEILAVSILETYCWLIQKGFLPSGSHAEGVLAVSGLWKYCWLFEEKKVPSESYEQSILALWDLSVQLAAWVVSCTFWALAQEILPASTLQAYCWLVEERKNTFWE